MSKIIKSESTIRESGKVALYKKLQVTDETEEIQEDAGPVMRGTVNINKQIEKIYDEAKKKAGQSAARILEDAYASRDRIVNTAEMDVRRLKAQAVEEGFQQGLADASVHIAEELKKMNAAVAEMNETARENDRIMKENVIQLALDMTEKILNKRVEENELELLEMVMGAVQSEKDKKHIHLQISNQLMRLVEQLDKELEPVRERCQSVIKVKAVDLPPGSCRVETSDGIIDASVFVQLENLREQLSETTGNHT